MMVSIAKTSIKYRGKMAENYEAKRMKQIRWQRENDIVTELLQKAKGTVLDCPVGTGRFFALYNSLKLKCLGVDSSEHMLELARGKLKGANWPGQLFRANAMDLSNIFKDSSVDHAVCVRFLDLIEEDAMLQVMRELMRVTRKSIICTIRWGDAYVPKVNTAVHDERKFKAFVRKHGWEVRLAKPIFEQGWHVLQLMRRIS